MRAVKEIVSVRVSIEQMMARISASVFALSARLQDWVMTVSMREFALLTILMPVALRKSWKPQDSFYCSMQRIWATASDAADALARAGVTMSVNRRSRQRSGVRSRFFMSISLLSHKMLKNGGIRSVIFPIISQISIQTDDYSLLL